MKKYKVIIYDFDGVILDSVNIKTDAFLEIYKNCDEETLSQIKNFHLTNGGISRFKKFEFFEKNILNKKINKNHIDSLAYLFEKIVKHKVVKASYIDFVIDFLNENMFTSKQYVCTGTPENEAIQIIKEKGGRPALIIVTKML